MSIDFSLASIASLPLLAAPAYGPARRSTSARVPGRVASLFAIAALLSFGSAPSVFAGECGDSVGGKRVACACGDIVVSTTRLLPGDPVVQETCERDGLVVRASRGTHRLQLDLGGQTLRGRGRGTGVLVVSGGQGGARIISSPPRGALEGFESGMRVVRSGAASRISGLNVVNNRRAGLTARSVGTVVEDVHATANGADGIHLSGSGVVVRGIISKTNAGNGLSLEGRDFVAEDLVLGANSRYGASARGVDIVLRNVQAERNGLGPVNTQGKGVVAEPGS